MAAGNPAAGGTPLPPAGTTRAGPARFSGTASPVGAWRPEQGHGRPVAERAGLQRQIACTTANYLQAAHIAASTDLVAVLPRRGTLLRRPVAIATARAAVCAGTL